VFPRVQRRLNEVGFSFDPWQQGFGTIALGCRADGKFAATVGGVAASIPRQVGKTYTVGGIIVGLCLEFPGLKAAWTSHHNRTTTNTFRSMQGLVKRKGIAPFLAPDRSMGIRTTNGEQEIKFRNDSVIMFGAREQGFGRGLDEIDVEVFDEAQILTLKALEDMVPATNQARNPHGGLIFFLGTPPRPDDPGEAFTAKRQQALKDKPEGQVVITRGKQAYVEFSADPDSAPDDQTQWPIMNPSFPHRTPLESMERMRENIPDDESWNREARGIWPKVSRHAAVVKHAAWQAMRRNGPSADVRPDAFGVDMSHGLDISIAACWLEGESAHLEEVWAGSNVAEALDWLVEAAGWQAEVVIDDISPAAQMVPELKARGVNVRRSSARDMAKACLLFETRANADKLTHGGQSTALTDALQGARKRPISDAGGWGWDRRDSTVTIHPIVAATLALLGGVTQGPKKPSGRIATVS